MPSSSAARKKNGLFGPSSKKEWTEAANREIESGQSSGKLLQLFYDHTDLPPSTVYQLPSSQNEFLEPRAWSNQPRIHVANAETANRQALDYLSNGADGILFELSDVTNPAILLKGIQLNYCQTTFLADIGHKKFFVALAEHVKQNKIEPSSIEGAIFWKNNLAEPHQVLQLFAGWEKFHALGILDTTSTSVSSEIASLLAKAVIQIDTCTNNGISVTESIRAQAFLTETQRSLFQEIAKLKVLRSLFSQIANSFQSSSLESAHIHAITRDLNQPAYEPHGNLIKGTLESMGAIFGGCNALTVDNADAGMARIALNTSLILREEAHLGKVADPTAGSYYLESLINQLGQESWNQFQQLLA